MEAPKMQQQEDSWTHVPSRNKRHKPQPAATLSSFTNPPSRDLSFEKLSAEFTSKLKIYQNTTCRKTLLQLLTRIAPGEQGWQLRKAICIGCGSFSRENLECRRRSVWQFVVFYDLAKHILGVEEMFAQEPAFTALDGEFLAGLGVKVLEVGTGLGQTREELGEETVLFEAFVDMDAGMMRDLVEGGVGLYVGSSVGGILGRIGESEVRRLAGVFKKGREMVKFPAFEIDENVMDGMRIYWTEEEEEEE